MEVLRWNNSTSLGGHTRTRGVVAVAVVVVEEVTPMVVGGAVAGVETTIRMVAINTMTLQIIIQETTII